MKKVFIYIAAALGAFILTTTVILMVSKDSALHQAIFEKKDERTLSESELYDVSSFDEMKALAETFELRYSKVDDFYTVYDVPAFGAKAEMFYLFGSSGKTEYIKTYVLLFDYASSEEENSVVDFTADQLKTKVECAFSQLGLIHGIDIDTNYFIFSNESLLDNNDVKSFEKIKNGEAHIEFLLLDTDDHYWKIRTETMEDGIIFFEIEKYYSSDEFVDAIPNIRVQ